MSPSLQGMLRLPGGEFLMGSGRHYPEEGPVRRAAVDGFWIDETPVTNGQFASFVAATGYVTLAEQAPDPADYPGMDPALAQPASLVFTPTSGPVSLADPLVWWRLMPEACWRRPRGPGSGLAGIEDHPVVHLAHADAVAFAHWACKSLPSEAEWEYAARGGLEAAAYAWGEALEPGGAILANYWRGPFPWGGEGMATFRGTTAVRTYPPNGFGLWDMIGNVWEWTDDHWSEGPGRGAAPTCCGRPGPRAPGETLPRKVLKGGSHLCAESYCQRYRPAARYPQPIDTSTSHVGFRCVVRGRG